MAQCPKCGYRLKLTDISQYCPCCKTNLRFYNFEENFIREAKIAELTQAGMFAAIRRLKAAFIGSPLVIARLVVMLLPVAGLLLPAGSYVVTLPFKQVGYQLSGLGLFNLFSGGDLAYILQMCGAQLVGAEFAALRSSLLLYLLPAVLAVCLLLGTLLCFVSLKKMPVVLSAFSAGGAVFSLVAALGVALASENAGGVLVSFQSGIGLYVLAALFAVAFAVNFMIVKKGISVQYDEGVLARIAIWEKVQAGELELDDLPQPVVQTAETRAIEQEIQKQEQAVLARHAAQENAI